MHPFPLMTNNLLLRLSHFIDPKEIERLTYKNIKAEYIYSILPKRNK